jgi:hypothetical protein
LKNGNGLEKFPDAQNRQQVDGFGNPQMIFTDKKHLLPDLKISGFKKSSGHKDWSE